jgi:hypothetical protein
MTVCDHSYEDLEDAILDLDLLINTYQMANVYIDHRLFISKHETIVSFRIKTVD